MQAKVLANTLHMDRRAWLEARKQGLGGSDVATIAGLSKWKSQVQVFLEKTQAIEQEDIQSESAYFGNVLEEVVAQEFAKRTRLKVQRRNAIYSTQSILGCLQTWTGSSWEKELD